MQFAGSAVIPKSRALRNQGVKHLPRILDVSPNEKRLLCEMRLVKFVCRDVKAFHRVKWFSLS